MELGGIDSGKAFQREAEVKIDISVDPTVNYASYQNNVPLIRGVTLSNRTDEPLREVEVVVRCEPAYAETMRLRFERLDARESRGASGTGSQVPAPLLGGVERGGARARDR